MDQVRTARRGRSARAAAIVAAVGAIAVGGAGCGAVTGVFDDPDPVSAQPATLSAPVTVAGGDEPCSVSIEVSKALFEGAPVVVVAAAGDRSGRHAGSVQATRMGVPLLLVQAKDRSDLKEASAEISRLQAGHVLAMSPSVAQGLKEHVDASVVTDPGQLPTVTPAASHRSAAVLIRDTADDGHSAWSQAASATAHAAGATTIPVKGNDLRSDPSVIKALSTRKPRHLLAVGPGFKPTPRLTQRVAVAKTGVQLPGGGQKLFPGRRLVALYGHPGTSALGVLGAQDLAASITRAKTMADKYDPLSLVPVIPTFEIIATVASGAPGPDGDYSTESSVAWLRKWVKAAGEAGMYVVLDLQPGRANLLDQAKLYAPLLKLPYVGLALDPEWKLTPTQVPLQQIGSVDASQINKVSAWLSELTAEHDLPQKLLVLHQFQLRMIQDEKDLNRSHDNIQLLIHMDGQGTQPVKDATWKAVTNAAPPGVLFGWKNFYDEDHPMLTPAQTMTKTPAPMMISYQ